jgi:hypothetical protein
VLFIIDHARDGFDGYTRQPGYVGDGRGHGFIIGDIWQETQLLGLVHLVEALQSINYPMALAHGRLKLNHLGER